MKIITLMPTRGLIFTKTQQALEEELLHNDQIPFILRTDNLPIPDCRNKLVENALQIPEWTHALLIDDDVIMPPRGLQYLIEVNTDIAVIDYPMHHTGEKWGDMGTATYDYWLPGQDWGDKPLAWGGLGCALVKREVFEKLSKPWFDDFGRTFDRDDDGKITLHSKKIDIGGGGEDVYFMLKAKEAGFSIKQAKGVAGHARIVRTVGALTQGKYSKVHRIAVNSRIERPYR